MDNLLFIQCVPVDFYFAWQIRVQIVNFRKFNISDKMHICVWYPEHREEELKIWREIQEKYPEVSIHFYKDEGVNLRLYISQLRPHTLKKYFKEFAEELKDKTFFYHDSDIIFNYLPDMEKLAQGDICWQSDCSSYLDYSYLHRKEEQGKIPDNEAIKLMAEIGGIDMEVIKSYDKNTGGAQSFLKGIDSAFWEDIEEQVLKIRSQFYWEIPGSINRRYFPGEHEGFQSWCADMWALNFALWKRGKVTQTTAELDFSWATDTYETYLKKPIFHNAGATNHQKGVFYKGAYINKSPFGADLPYDESTASHMYVKAIREVNL